MGPSDVLHYVACHFLGPKTAWKLDPIQGIQPLVQFTVRRLCSRTLPWLVSLLGSMMLLRVTRVLSAGVLPLL